MRKLMQSWWAIAVPAATILMLLGAVGLPTMFPVLRATWVRFALIALVAAGFGIAVLWRWWRGRRAADALTDGLAEPDAAGAEASALDRRMRDALAQLKRQGGARRNYLYDRPWFVIIGPPGAGKTTALLNSGLRFPWSDTAMQGIGGTRTLDFWFADDAVLVDTAGRYTTQDSDKAVDAAGWERFLTLLRRTRPLEPINGIVVAIGIDELLGADRAGLDAHAAAIRRRLAELGASLKVRAPVYLMLTKADLLAGFTEYFGDLSAEGRRAVLGETLAYDTPADAAAFAAAFDRAEDAVRQRAAKRMQEEPDRDRRGLIVAFPAQLGLLRTRLSYFVEGAFGSASDETPLLRGFYLASGVQSGAPFDRVLGAMASVYDAPRAAPVDGRGRAYFINRFVTEVMFAEAGMVRPAPAIRRRRRLTLMAGMGAIAVCSAVMIGLWINAFSLNRDFQSALLTEAQAATGEARAAGIDLVEVRASDPDLEQALPMLNRLRALPGGYAASLTGGPRWTMRLGLYQGGHALAAQSAYLEALQRVMLPRILLRAEQAMREQTARPDMLYAPLKTYLMLGGYGPLDRDAARAWIVEDWRAGALAGADRAEVRGALAAHLDAMLADPDLGRVWPGRRAPLDAALIARTRQSIQNLPLAERAYAILKQRAAAMGGADWRADAVLADGDRAAFANGDAVMGASVPWFLTRAGYIKAYRPGLGDVQAQLDGDLWVLGNDGGKRSIRDQLPAIRGAIAARYAEDYIAAWDAVLATPQPADYFRDASALGAISRTPSPVKVLLLEAVRNTRLAGGGGAVPGQVDAGQTIQAHFAPVASFTGADDKGEAPVDMLLAAIRRAAAANAATGVPGAATSGAVQGQLATALGELSTAGVVAPPQLKPFVEQATRSGAGAATRTARAALGSEYASNVLPACRSAAGNRYPFVAGAAADANVADMQRVFGINGTFDQFVRDRLAGVIDATGESWRWKRGDPVAAGFAPSSTVQFQRAAALRDLIAAGLAMNVRLEGTGAAVRAVELSAGGTAYRFEPGSREAKPLLWNMSLLPAAHLILFGDAGEVRRMTGRGPFALFRLMDAGRIENAGPSRLRVHFGDGEASAVLAIDLPSPDSPFGRGGPFAFRCPARL